MNSHELTWYMQEISMHSLGAGMNFEDLTIAVARPEMRQTRFVWFQLTSFLSHAAMISKYLDPIGTDGLKRNRRNALRQSLNISDQSSVLPRHARDNIEHFDERIDNWVGTSKDIVEIVLEDRSGYSCLNVEEKNVKRVLILDGLIFISEKRDQTKFELELVPLYEEIKRIGGAATDWVNNNSPYNFIYPQ